MPFKPGQSGNIAGKPKGAISTRLLSARESVEEVFNILQKDPKHSLLAFARNFPRDYYAIWAKLIPTSIRAELHTPEGIQINFNADAKCLPIGTNPESNSGILGEQESL